MLAAGRRGYADRMRASRKLATLVQRRLRMQRRVDALVLAAMAALVTAVPCVVGSRLLGHDGAWVTGAAAMVVLVAVAGVWLRLHPAAGPASAAAMADERLGLESRIATALALHDRSDAFAIAAVADAERVAPGQMRRVAAAFPLRWHPLAPWLSVAAVVAGMTWWLFPTRQGSPATDVNTVAIDAEQRLQQAEASEQAVREAVRLIEESPEARQALQETLAELEREGAKAELTTDPERRESEAGARAAALQERLQRELDSPEMLESRALADLLARLPELPELGKEVSQALKSGDFEKARAELERLAREASGKDPAKARAAQQTLENLAKAIEKAGQETSAAEQALREAGMDPKLAKDLQQAMQAVQQDPKLTPQQRQELQKKLQSCQNASSQCRNLSKAARECKSGSCSGSNSQLSRAAAQRRMDRALAKAMGQCRNGAAMGWSMPWQRQQAGTGRGGRSDGKGGREGGQGGKPRTDGDTSALPEDAYALKRESAGDGDPLDRAAAREFVRGEGLAGGQASAELKAVAAKVSAGLEEGTEEDPVPGRLKATHKRYFEQWKRRLEGGTPAGSGP